MKIQRRTAMTRRTPMPMPRPRPILAALVRVSCIAPPPPPLLGGVVEDVGVDDVCVGGAVVALGEEVVAAAAVVASLNCQPLNGIPSTLVTPVAVMDVLRQPDCSAKSLAYAKTWPEVMGETHWLTGATIDIDASLLKA
jgi:hypothetical protein